MKKCVNRTLQMNIDLDERLQKERVKGRILKRKKIGFSSITQMEILF